MLIGEEVLLENDRIRACAHAITAHQLPTSTVPAMASARQEKYCTSTAPGTRLVPKPKAQ